MIFYGFLKVINIWTYLFDSCYNVTIIVREGDDWMAVIQPPPIGRNIMNQRKQKGISLEELAKRSGVSKSMLSQIEQDKSNPTVVTVWKIARALDLQVQELIESGYGNIIEVIRSDDAPVIQSEDRLCRIRINSPIHMTDSLELYLITLKPGGKNVSMSHFPKAEEFLTVMEGKIKVVSGEFSAILQKGDTARYKADIDHVIENVSDSVSEAYLVVWLPR